MTDKSTLKLIEAIRANQVYVTDEVVHSATDRISTLIAERDSEKARVDRLESLLREAQSELHHILYKNMWTKRMELCRRIDAALKREQQ